MLRSIIGFLCFFVFMIMILFGIDHTAESTNAQDQQRQLDALRKAAITCYSVEGFYPNDLNYLKEYYGVYIDEQRFQIHYEYSGSNLMPDIRIFEKGDAQ